jgi:nucleotide-binding universal stress UspA family protein
MLTRILVPLDGSTLAESILPQVVELAALRRGEIHLLRVAHAHALPGAGAVEAQVRALDEARAYLDRLDARLRSQDLPVRSVVRYGQPVEEILDHALASGADLIAMSTHGRSGVRRVMLGSVAEAVVRRARIPVLLLRVTQDALTGVAAPGRTAPPRVTESSPPAAIRHILCPVDLTPFAPAVLESAGAVAARFNAALTVLHVVYDPLDPALAYPADLLATHPPLEHLREEMIRGAERELAQLAHAALAAVPYARTVVTAGVAYREILRFARTHDVDLIVMETRGRTGLDRWLSDSTAERVIRTAPCPVLSLRATAGDGGASGSSG